MKPKQYKQLLRKLGITNQAVADRCGYTREAITNVLNEKETPNNKRLNHLMGEWDELINNTLEEKNLILDVNKDGTFNLY